MRGALGAFPGSLRALARAAGLDHALLVRIRQGRQAPTGTVVQALAGALAAWGEQCAALAKMMQEGGVSVDATEWRVITRGTRDYQRRPRGKGSRKARQSAEGAMDRILDLLRGHLEMLEERAGDLHLHPEYAEELRELRRHLNAVLVALERGK